MYANSGVILTSRYFFAIQNFVFIRLYTVNSCGFDVKSVWCRYVGKMSRDEAEMNLERFAVGTYLVRLSTTSGRQGEYALSVR